jgi:hypothetical protein
MGCANPVVTGDRLIWFARAVSEGQLASSDMRA